MRKLNGARSRNTKNGSRLKSYNNNINNNGSDGHNNNKNNYYDYEDFDDNDKSDLRLKKRNFKNLSWIILNLGLFGLCIYKGLKIFDVKSKGAQRENERNQSVVVEEDGSLNRDDEEYIRNFHAIYPPIRDPVSGEILKEDPLGKSSQLSIWGRMQRHANIGKPFFEDHKNLEPEAWELVDDTALSSKPKVDFTEVERTYPNLMYDIPDDLSSYPPLETLGDIMKRWPQDDIDNPPIPFQEKLLHFDYMDPIQREAAEKFRDAKVPFKVYNVPDIISAGVKWSDDSYVATGFKHKKSSRGEGVKALRGKRGNSLGVQSHCQESRNNFFCFYIKSKWYVDKFGVPPTKDNDFSYEKWAKHARYADRE